MSECLLNAWALQTSNLREPAGCWTLNDVRTWCDYSDKNSSHDRESRRGCKDKSVLVGWTGGETWSAPTQARADHCMMTVAVRCGR